MTNLDIIKSRSKHLHEVRFQWKIITLLSCLTELVFVKNKNVNIGSFRRWAFINRKYIISKKTLQSKTDI